LNEQISFQLLIKGV